MTLSFKALRFIGVLILFSLFNNPLQAQCKGLNMPNGNDYIHIPSPFYGFSDAITVEAKVLISNNTSAGAPWMGQSSPAVNSPTSTMWSWEGSATDNSFTWLVNYGGTIAAVASTTLTNGWHHIATVSSSTVISIYVDGILNATATQTLPGPVLNNSVAVLQIGHDSRYAAGTTGKNGNYLISDFRVWRTERTATEISTNATLCIGTNTDLVLYHQFEDGTGKSYATPSVGSYGALTNMSPATAWGFGPTNECCNSSCTPNVSVITTGTPGLCPGSMTVTAGSGGQMNNWTQKAGGFPGRADAVGFSIGSKGYMATGYSIPGSNTLNDLWEYDPITNTWSQKANVPGFGRARAFGFNIGNKGYVGGGQNGGGGEYADFYEYDPNTNTWISRAPYPVVRQFVVSFSIGNKGYGGTGGLGNSTSFYEFDPVANTWTQKANFPGAGRTGASGFSIGNRGYLGLGWTGGNNFATDFYEYDPLTNTWTQKATFPAVGRWMASDLTIGNKGYIIAGVTGINTNLNDFWQYDPALNTWTQGPNFAGSVTSGAMAFSIGNRGYMGAGSPNTTNQFWEFSTGFYNYFWNPGGFTGSNLVPPGPGPFTLTVLSANNCTAASTFTSNVIPPPVITISQNTLCNAQTMTLSPSGADTYTFSSGPVISPSVNTNYLITGTSTLTGCSNSAVVTVTVHPHPTVYVNSGNVCSGSTFTIVRAGAQSYTYSTGSMTFIPTSNTVFSVTGSNVYGCINPTPTTGTVTVIPVPTISVNSGTVCSGGTFVIAPVGATAYTVQGGSFSVSPSGNTSYTVVGEDGGCLSNVVSSSVTALSSPTIGVNSGSMCANGSFSIQPTGALSYTVQGGNWLVTPTITSNYTVAGTNAQGCVSQTPAIAQVTVHATPTIGVNSGSICAGNSFTFNPTGANSYTIQGGNLVVSPTTNTTYTLAGTSSQGCVSQTTAVAQVTVHSTPSISVNSGSICSGNSFTINPSGANSYTVQGGNLVVTPTINTTYTIIGSSPEGCVSQSVAASQVTVYTTPTISVNSGSICEGNSFTILPSGANSYTVQGGSFTVTPSATTSYTVIGISTQGCPGQSVAISQVSVHPTPTISVNSGSICEGRSFTIVPSGAANYTVQGGSFVVSPLVSTVYIVQGISNMGCPANSVVASNVVVNTLPDVIINATPTVICLGWTSSLSASGALNYTWTPPIPFSGLVSPNVTTNYILIGEDQNGCQNTTTLTLVVDLCTLTGSGNNKANEINIFPNPSTGLFFIDVSDHHVQQIKVRNDLGQVLKTFSVTADHLELNLSELSQGIYFLEFIGDAHPLPVKKVVRN